MVNSSQRVQLCVSLEDDAVHVQVQRPLDPQGQHDLSGSVASGHHDPIRCLKGPFHSLLFSDRQSGHKQRQLDHATGKVSSCPRVDTMAPRRQSVM